MSNNQVIELRQLGTDTIQYTDDSGIIKNGDFKTRLKKPITLNQGDTLRLNQIFLQTEELEDDQIKIDSPITLQLNFNRYIRDCINAVFPRYDQLTNTTAAGDSIPNQFTPSTIVQQNSFSVFGGGAQPPLKFDGTANPNAGKFCSYIRTGEVMMECRTLSSDGVFGAEIRELLGITFRKIDPTKATTAQIVLIKYTTALNEESIITEQIPALNDTNTHTINLKLAGKTKPAVPPATIGDINISIVNANILGENNLVLDSSIQGVRLQGVACLATPISASRTVVIPSGIYHTAELATVITDAFNDTGLENQQFRSTADMIQFNQFLGLADNFTSVGADSAGFPNANALGTSENLTMFVNGSGANFNIYGTYKAKTFGGATECEAIPNKPNILCGTDSFSLEYDDSLSKYKITKMHLSINDINGQTSNQILDNPLPQPIFIGTITHNGVMIDRFSEPNENSALGVAFGGIILNSLSAYDSNGNFINFWEDTLGFDTSLITTHIDQAFSSPALGVKTAPKYELSEGGTTDLGPQYGTVAETVSTFSFAVSDGVNITTDQATISGIHYADSKTLDASSGRVHGSATQIGHRYFNTISAINPDSTIPIYQEYINTTLTKQIFARDVFQSKNLNFAYYLVEINALVDNDFISSGDIKNKIFSVINRYYQLGGYLSGTNSGIQYTHEGESIMISELSCRILQADGTIANNLKSDNTVFLELLRG